MHIDYKGEITGNNSNNTEEQAIINILKENSYITQEEILREINKSLRTVKTRMAEMKEKGFIKREKGKRNGKRLINN